MTPTAYLRVYVPGEEPSLPEHEPALRPRVLTRGRYGAWFESLREDALVIEHRGRRYTCPRHARLRMLEGLLAFRNAYPAPVGGFLVPEAFARRAVEELDRIRVGEPGVRSHILASPFHVPVRWFAAFDPGERYLGPGPSGLTIRYRTGRRSALRRLERAERVLEGAGFDERVIAEVRGLTEWLQAFPADALVELDYGGTAGLFSEGELAADESAADVAASLGALQRGDPEGAGEHYSRLVGRWFYPQSLANAS